MSGGCRFLLFWHHSYKVTLTTLQYFSVRQSHTFVPGIKNDLSVVIDCDGQYSYKRKFVKYPNRHGPDFHRPRFQITIDSPDFPTTVNQLYLAAIKFGVWTKVDLFGAH